jgi:hypothetical protein
MDLEKHYSASYETEVMWFEKAYWISRCTMHNSMFVVLMPIITNVYGRNI